MRKNSGLPAAAAAVIAAAVLLSACSADYSHIAGYDDIMTARALYSGLNAAHFTVTNVNSGEVTQEMTYLYNSDDVLMYSYYGTDGSLKYYEYHNGSDYCYSENGEWKTILPGDENYIVYTRAVRLSVTDAGLIFIKPDSVTQSDKASDGENTVITLKYDVQQLNSSMAAQLGLVGELTAFEVIYTIDKDGYCIKMEQKGEAQQDSDISTVDYLLQIDSMNDVSAVEKPEIAV